MPYITRDIEEHVMRISNQFPALLITGPRQVGKTTMMQKLMQGTGRTYVTLDDLNYRALAKNDPALFFQIFKPPVLIDEVQYGQSFLTILKF